ncbi:MAG: recombinase family protein [Chloroflexota bacterium]
MNDPQQGAVPKQSLPVVQPRFFTMPKLDERLKVIVYEPKLYEKRKFRKEDKVMRYAAYMRISSEEQVGNYSIDAQRRAITTWVQAQDGQLVKLYIDEAQSGRTAHRPAFLQMRQDAHNSKFDALVVHKFDRFARNRTDALAIKSLLRYDYNIKVFSATEPSEDSDGPIGALIEGIMECVAEWYSRNLGSEISKGKLEKGTQGLHNNNAPFGYKRNGRYLAPNPDEVPGLIMAFQEYSTGKYSYADLAKLLNKHSYKNTSGRLFSKEAIRGILRNKIYLGQVKHQETTHNSQGRRTFTAPVQWFEGQHEPLIDEELFARCQSVRGERTTHRQARHKYNPYLLRGLIYCHNCCANAPENTDFPAWDKMHAQAQGKHSYLYYRCNSRTNGFSCQQPGVHIEPEFWIAFGC